MDSKTANYLRSRPGPTLTTTESVLIDIAVTLGNIERLLGEQAAASNVLGPDEVPGP